MQLLISTKQVHFVGVTVLYFKPQTGLRVAGLKSSCLEHCLQLLLPTFRCALQPTKTFFCGRHTIVTTKLLRVSSCCSGGGLVCTMSLPCVAVVVEVSGQRLQPPYLCRVCVAFAKAGLLFTSCSMPRGTYRAFVVSFSTCSSTALSTQNFQCKVPSCRANHVFNILGGAPQPRARGDPLGLATAAGL